jgi:hypothetical protein
MEDRPSSEMTPQNEPAKQLISVFRLMNNYDSIPGMPRIQRTSDRARPNGWSKSAAYPASEPKINGQVKLFR